MRDVKRTTKAVLRLDISAFENLSIVPTVGRAAPVIPCILNMIAVWVVPTVATPLQQAEYQAAASWMRRIVARRPVATGMRTSRREEHRNRDHVTDSACIAWRRASGPMREHT